MTKIKQITIYDPIDEVQRPIGSQFRLCLSCGKRSLKERCYQCRKKMCKRCFKDFLPTEKNQKVCAKCNPYKNGTFTKCS